MISIIIPTFNEEGHIAGTVQKLKVHGDLRFLKEIIVADGCSDDRTKALAISAGCVVVDCKKGRAAQMNAAAKIARGSILYFLHADTIPPNGFCERISHSIQGGAMSGCFQLQFDVPHWFLQANAWFTRFDVNAFRYGDQSFFITKDLFVKIAGFSEDHIIMEDQEIIMRAKVHGRFEIVEQKVITSARKYVENGVFKMQAIFFMIFFMYRLGFSQQELLQAYKRLISQDKL